MSYWGGSRHPEARVRVSPNRGSFILGARPGLATTLVSEDPLGGETLSVYLCLCVQAGSLCFCVPAEFRFEFVH